jgi:hypothetical protein
MVYGAADESLAARSSGWGQAAELASTSDSPETDDATGDSPAVDERDRIGTDRENQQQES